MKDGVVIIVSLFPTWRDVEAAAERVRLAARGKKWDRRASLERYHRRQRDKRRASV